MPAATSEQTTLETIQTALRTVDGVASSSVVISPIAPARLIAHKRDPIIQISRRDQTADEDSPGIRKVRIGITAYVVNRRDDSGEAAMLELMALQRAIDLKIQYLTRTAVPMTWRNTSTGSATLDDSEMLVYSDAVYEAVCTVDAIGD